MGESFPTDFHIFQRGRYTTNQYISGISMCFPWTKTRVFSCPHWKNPSLRLPWYPRIDLGVKLMMATGPRSTLEVPSRRLDKIPYKEWKVIGKSSHYQRNIGKVRGKSEEHHRNMWNNIGYIGDEAGFCLARIFHGKCRIDSGSPFCTVSSKPWSWWHAGCAKEYLIWLYL